MPSGTGGSGGGGGEARAATAGGGDAVDVGASLTGAAPSLGLGGLAAGGGGGALQTAYAEHGPQKDGALEHMDGTLTQLASGTVAQYEKATHAA